MLTKKRRGLATGGVSIAPNVNVFPLPAGDITPVPASDAITSTNQFAGIANGMPTTTNQASPPINTSNIIGEVPVGGTSGAPNNPYMTSLPMSALTGGANTSFPGTQPTTLGASGAPAPAANTAQPAQPPAPISVSGNVGNSPFNVSVPSSGAFQATGPGNSVINFSGANPNSPTITGSNGNTPVTINNPFYNAAATAAARGGRMTLATGGGLAQCFDQGGPPSTPWQVRQEARSEDAIPHGSGLFATAGAGRTDMLNRDVPAGGYVVPADVVSGLGEGNTMAGSNVIDKMMNTGPYGTRLPHGSSRGPGIPHPPPEYKEPRQQQAGGGASAQVPVVVAGGEHFIPPEAIQQKFGELDRGHKILDAWVIHERKKHIKTLQKLPGPKK